jgi:hypothetical protein
MSILIQCIAEFDLKASVFFTANIDNENMYWECSRRIFNYLNSGQQVSVYRAFIVIIIIIIIISSSSSSSNCSSISIIINLFCISKIELL